MAEQASLLGELVDQAQSDATTEVAVGAEAEVVTNTELDVSAEAEVVTNTELDVSAEAEAVTNTEVTPTAELVVASTEAVAPEMASEALVQETTAAHAEPVLLSEAETQAVLTAAEAPVVETALDVAVTGAVMETNIEVEVDPVAEAAHASTEAAIEQPILDAAEAEPISVTRRSRS
eukprot:3645982-Prymnesium_polylepis.2